MAAARCGWIAARAAETVAAAATRVASPAWTGRVGSAAREAGMSPENAAEALRNFCPLLTAENLHELRRRKANQTRNPSLAFHVLAGNLFLSGIESVIHAWLAGSTSLVRCSSADVAFPALWRTVVAEVDREFASTLHVAWWPRDRTEWTRAVAIRAGTVAAFGDDASVAAVGDLVPPGIRFLPHGSRVSFAVVGPGEMNPCDLDRVVDALAYDFSVYDQQGCLSPRAVFVPAEAAATVTELCARLAEAMRRLAVRLPRRTLSLEERSAHARRRDEALVANACGGEEFVLSQAGDDFLLTVAPAAGFTLGCLDRHVDVRTYRQKSEISAALAPFSGKIACIGLAGLAGDWSALARETAATRLCRLGEMQRPPLGWTHDGGLAFE